MSKKVTGISSRFKNIFPGDAEGVGKVRWSAARLALFKIMERARDVAFHCLDGYM